jgi:hypothetical protein
VCVCVCVIIVATCHGFKSAKKQTIALSVGFGVKRLCRATARREVFLGRVFLVDHRTQRCTNSHEAQEEVRAPSGCGEVEESDAFVAFKVKEVVPARRDRSMGFF